MSTLSSRDQILLFPHEYDFLERVVEVVGFSRPDFSLPEANEKHTAEVPHEQSEAVVELLQASVELDLIFAGMVKERLKNANGLSETERIWLQERKQVLKERRAVAKSMLSSVAICTAFLDFINPAPQKFNS